MTRHQARPQRQVAEEPHLPTQARLTSYGGRLGWSIMDHHTKFPYYLGYLGSVPVCRVRGSLSIKDHWELQLMMPENPVRLNAPRPYVKDLTEMMNLAEAAVSDWLERTGLLEKKEVRLFLKCRRAYLGDLYPECPIRHPGGPWKQRQEFPAWGLLDDGRSATP